MRNFNYNSSSFNSELSPKHSYKVSRTDPSYSFYMAEYYGLPRDLDGNLLLPEGDKVKEKPSIVKNLILNVKKFLSRKERGAIVVKKSSEAYSYFVAEFGYSSLRNNRELDVVIPCDEIPQIKTR